MKKIYDNPFKPKAEPIANIAKTQKEIAVKVSVPTSYERSTIEKLILYRPSNPISHCKNSNLKYSLELLKLDLPFYVEKVTSKQINIPESTVLHIFYELNKDPCILPFADHFQLFLILKETKNNVTNSILKKKINEFLETDYFYSLQEQMKVPTTPDEIILICQAIYSESIEGFHFFNILFENLEGIIPNNALNMKQAIEIGKLLSFLHSNFEHEAPVHFEQSINKVFDIFKKSIISFETWDEEVQKYLLVEVMSIVYFYSSYLNSFKYQYSDVLEQSLVSVLFQRFEEGKENFLFIDLSNMISIAHNISDDHPEFAKFHSILLEYFLNGSINNDLETFLSASNEPTDSNKSALYVNFFAFFLLSNIKSSDIWGHVVGFISTYVFTLKNDYNQIAQFVGFCSRLLSRSNRKERWFLVNMVLPEDFRIIYGNIDSIIEMNEELEREEKSRVEVITKFIDSVLAEIEEDVQPQIKAHLVQLVCFNFNDLSDVIN